jgi:hypothetical protein
MRVRTCSCLLVAALAVGCSRPSPRPAARPAPRAPAPVAATPAAAPIVIPVEDEAAELMNPLGELSRHPDNAAGLRALFTELAHESAAGDREGRERIEERLRVDADRFALAFTFEGNRRMAARVVPGAGERLEAKLAAVRALGDGVAVTVVGATGAELADGRPHGLDPRVTALREFVRPMVRYYRVVLRSGRGEVVFEPMAFAGGRWVWLAEPWTALTPVVGPTAPPTGAAR